MPFSAPSQVHLEEVYFVGPKLNYYTPGLDAPVPCMLTFYFNALWTCSQVTSKEAKGPVSLCANIADMCVPHQIVSNGYAKILGFLYTLSKIVPSKI